MMNTTAKLSALFVGGVMALTMTAGVSRADTGTSGDSRTFCQAIGIAEQMRMQCAQDMDAAGTPDARDQTAAQWVTRSPLASKDPGSLYQPPVDQNVKNGTPGTPYEDKVLGVSNQVSAQIHRAMKIDHLE